MRRKKRRLAGAGCSQVSCFCGREGWGFQSDVNVMAWTISGITFGSLDRVMYKYDGRRSRTINTAWEMALSSSIYKKRLLPWAARPGLSLPGLTCRETKHRGKNGLMGPPRFAQMCASMLVRKVLPGRPGGPFGRVGLPLLCFRDDRVGKERTRMMRFYVSFAQRLSEAGGSVVPNVGRALGTHR